jgi:DNA-binding response OmpR family regulator
MPYHIAIVEDDALIAGMVRSRLQQEGLETLVFPDGESFLKSLRRRLFDLLILDINLPGISGCELLPNLRAAGHSFPVLMLTVHGEVEVKVQAFEQGADDYLTKPFDMLELLGRVKAMLRRSRETERPLPAAGTLLINDRRIYLDSRVCEGKTSTAILSEKEINLLVYFYRHPGETMKRGEILEIVWGMDVDPTPRTIDNFILKFRRLFEDDPAAPEHFLTARGQGYRFEP